MTNFFDDDDFVDYDAALFADEWEVASTNDFCKEAEYDIFDD